MYYINRDPESGLITYQFQHPSRAEPDERLGFWLDGTDKAIVIYPQEGRAAIETVTVDAAGIETIVTMMKEEGDK